MSLTAADIMTSKVITAHPEDSVPKIARLLSEHDISAVPVCDREGILVGMVSEGDLIRPIGKELASKRAWWLNLLAEGENLAPSFLESLKEESHSARDLMVTPVITASFDAGLPELADLIGRHHVKHIPILRDGQLVGIVSRADIVRAIATRPDAVSDAS